MSLDTALGRRPWLLIVAVLLIVGIALRAPNLGHPLIDFDEQFYLLVGDRIWQGAIPYVDIWDRKPAGLFLLFAAMRALGGEGVLQYEIVASVFAIATAVTIAAIVRPLAGIFAGIVGGVSYLIWLNLVGGSGGQAPVFYNLITAIAAACVLRAVVEDDKGRFVRLAFASMIAMGIAIQIKPTVVFEGTAFGITLLHAQWRTDRNVRRLAGFACALVATALVPTALALGYYGLIGHADAFWYANVSVFARHMPPHTHEWSKLGLLMIVLAPLCAVSAIGLSTRRLWEDRRVAFLAFWLLAALAGLFAIKPYYNHYALPVLVPLSVVAALAVGRHRVWAAGVLVTGLIWLSLAGFFSTYFSVSGNARAHLAKTTAMIVPHLHGGCLWVFSGPSILYHSTNACLATPYAFPVHLNYAGEDGAIGVDPAAEVRRTLAARPSVITTFDGKSLEDRNPRTWALVRTALAHDYELVGTQEIFGGLLYIYALRQPVTGKAMPHPRSL